MTQNDKSLSPLRQRMIEDMRLRKLSPMTQTATIRAVKKFTLFLGQSPGTASAEGLRRYQLHLVEQGISSGNLNPTITGLKFFFATTLERPEAMAKMSHVVEPRKLPLVLSLEEVTRLLQAAGGPKYQAALGVAYGAGLRASEVVHLTVSAIDSERMVIRVEQGKGKRDRYAMLSPAFSFGIVDDEFKGGSDRRSVSSRSQKYQFSFTFSAHWRFNEPFRPRSSTTMRFPRPEP